MHYRRWTRHGDPLFINPKCNRDGGYKTRHKQYQKKWRQENWAYYKAYLNASKKRIKQATPAWVNKQQILDIYLGRPKGYHVDHIVPINGKDVCGLNVPWNLQYLPEIENLRKSNRH